MDLFGLLPKGGKNDDIKLVKRSRKLMQPSVTVIGGSKSGNNLTVRIKACCAQVQQHLGKYKDEYIIIQDEETLAEYVKAIQKNEIFSLDNETAGRYGKDSALDPITCIHAGVSIYTPGQKAAYIPLNHISYITGVKVSGQLEPELVADYLNKLCNDKCKAIFHNTKFDIRVLKHCMSIVMKPFFDTQPAVHLLNENANSHRLKDSYSNYCAGEEDKNYYKFEDLFERIPFTHIPIQTAYLYAARDAFITFKLYEYCSAQFAKPELEGPRTVFKRIEVPLMEAIAEMEDNGIGVDKKRNTELLTLYKDKMDTIEARFHESLGRFRQQIREYRSKGGQLPEDININSSKQIAAILYDIVGLKSHGKKDARGTGEEVLEKLKDKDELPAIILEYRGAAKVFGTYLDNIDGWINQKTGRIHSSFNPNGTVTGRFSSSRPNMQNIPKRGDGVIVRTQYVAKEGNVLVSADYSQQEPRILAYMADDEKLIEAYNEGKDLYAAMVSSFYNRPYEQCLEKYSKEAAAERSKMKNIVLAVNYGKGDDALAQDLKVTIAEARRFKEDLFRHYPKIKQFMQDSEKMARTYGYVDTVAGRMRRLPDMMLPDFEFKYLEGASADFDPLDFDAKPEQPTEVPQVVREQWEKRLKKAWGRTAKMEIKEQAKSQGILIVDNTYKISEAIRQVVNSRIQGSAGDMIKLAMIKIHNNKELRKLEWQMNLQVHDEIVGECPPKNLPRVKELVKTCMLDAAAELIDVKMDVDVVAFKGGWDGEKLK